MVCVNLPYDFGQFVKTYDSNNRFSPEFRKIIKSEPLYCGTVSAYTLTNDGWLVWVSAYKQPITGEFLAEEIEPMTMEEIKELIGSDGT